MRLGRTSFFVFSVCGLMLGCVYDSIALASSSDLIGVPLNRAKTASVQAQPVQLNLPGSPRTPVIQGLKIQNGSNIRITEPKTGQRSKFSAVDEPYAFLVMLRRGTQNTEFCEALVRNLQFLGPEILALSDAYSQPEIHGTILFDVRSNDELGKIERPSQLSKDDCEELVPNHAYDTTLFLATRLGIRIGSGGPWIIVIDPRGRSAIVFDFADQKGMFDAGIDHVTDVLQDPELWKNKSLSVWSFLSRLWSGGPPIRIIPIPPDFPR